ncbi:hypothetical protein Poli38472_009113 [Pythium oligandrum]|uniref:Uncharacterized protein n=1 Tax=Pythium oligandrum TaxID=41045 RepID=A0A8K1CLL3_PYTOL|nr:hypothetical protein Poli38472_009113 [Pythium oligandrum]|eukprot:TMW64946.1 hypothetical protein Poli38472_009113 [Pythium oligandrum]
MQCHVPFQILALPSTASSILPHLPGFVHDHEQESQAFSALWRSSAEQEFPQEVGLYVLASDRYAIDRLEIVFARAKRPSRMLAYAATGSNSTYDVVSAYCSAAFRAIGSPFHWPPESILTKSSATNASIVLEPPRSCVFFKFILFKPHITPLNPSATVAIKDLILHGILLPRSLFASSSLLPAPVPFTPEENEKDPDLALLSRLLTTAGLSDATIREVCAASSVSKPKPAPDLPQSPIASPSTPPRSHVADLQQPHNILDSIFDQAMREFLQARASQDRLLRSFRSPRPLQLASMRVDSLEAVVVYTFGAFFAQCALEINDEELQSHAVNTAERLSPLLLDAGMPRELVYEGLLALLLLVLSETTPLSVFHDALQLTRTLFHADTAASTLDCITHLGSGRILTGLRSLLDKLLDTRHCWIRRGTATTIDREFLRTFRLLLEQNATQKMLFKVLVPLKDHPSPSLLAIINRFRLFRWLLQRERAQLPPELIPSLRLYCQETRQSLSNQLSQSTTIPRLIAECLALIDTSNSPLDLNAQLQTMKKHLQTHPEPSSPRHTPLFVAFPLTSPQREALVRRQQQYLDLHPRPTALYHHTFTPESLVGHDATQVFHKGNIVFKGDVETRSEPFERLELKLPPVDKPFAFDESLLNHPKHQKLTKTTPFAAFQGTILPRNGPRTPSPEPKPRPQSPLVSRTRVYPDPKLRAPQVTPSPVVPERRLATAEPVETKPSPEAPSHPKTAPAKPRPSESKPNATSASQENGCVVQ